MKKLLAFVLSLLMLAMVFVSCDININISDSRADGKPDAVEDGETETLERPTEIPTEAERFTDVPKPTDIYDPIMPYGPDWSSLDFEGETLVILVRNDYKVSREWESQDIGDDELDLAIYNRNEVVEDTLNLDVRIKLCASDSYESCLSNLSTYISQDVDNKLHEFDMVANYGFKGMKGTLRDYYVNLLDVDTFPYFDFDLCCWNQSIVKNGTVNDQLYLCAGDMNLSMFDSAMVIWHNMDLYDRIKSENDPNDIQDLVLNGQWTYKELYKWASYYDNCEPDDACVDIYGVSIQGASQPEQPGEAIPYAWGVDFVTTNADGTHSYNLVGNTKAEKALAAFRNIYGSDGNAYRVFNEEKSDICTCGAGGHFANGGVLFKGDVLFESKESNTAIREMEDRYSLLPWPKYDEAQSYYATTSQDYFNTVSVLDHSESAIPTKGEAVSAYLQFATEYSYAHVRGYYFERIVKPTFFGTNDSDGHVTKSVTLFVAIVDNLGYEFETIYSSMLNNVISKVWTQSIHNGGTVQSGYEADQPAYDDALRDLDEWFGLYS